MLLCQSSANSPECNARTGLRRLGAIFSAGVPNSRPRIVAYGVVERRKRVGDLTEPGRIAI